MKEHAKSPDTAPKSLRSGVVSGDPIGLSSVGQLRVVGIQTRMVDGPRSAHE